MEAWKKFEISGKVEDYLAYCKDVAETQNRRAENSVSTRMEGDMAGGRYGTAGKGNRDGAFGYQCK